MNSRRFLDELAESARWADTVEFLKGAFWGVVAVGLMLVFWFAVRTAQGA